MMMIRRCFGAFDTDGLLHQDMAVGKSDGEIQISVNYDKKVTQTTGKIIDLGRTEDVRVGKQVANGKINGMGSNYINGNVPLCSEFRAK